MYTKVITDFAERTKKNLAAIDRLQGKGEDVFETTQLLILISSQN